MNFRTPVDGFHKSIGIWIYLKILSKLYYVKQKENSIYPFYYNLFIHKFALSQLLYPRNKWFQNTHLVEPFSADLRNNRQRSGDSDEPSTMRAAKYRNHPSPDSSQTRWLSTLIVLSLISSLDDHLLVRDRVSELKQNPASHLRTFRGRVYDAKFGIGAKRQRFSVDYAATGVVTVPDSGSFTNRQSRLNISAAARSISQR